MKHCFVGFATKIEEYCYKKWFTHHTSHGNHLRLTPCMFFLKKIACSYVPDFVVTEVLQFAAKDLE